jgi:hypothetical protein
MAARPCGTCDCADFSPSATDKKKCDTHPVSTYTGHCNHPEDDHGN